MAQEDDIRTAYQGAIDMATHEGDAVWVRFNVVLVANSIILLALTTGQNSIVPYFDKLLSIGGIILCVMWLMLMKRGFTYEVYYVVAARVLEQKLSSGSIQTLSLGKSLSEGKPVIIDGNRFQMSPLGRIKNRTIVDIVIGIFIAVYFYLLFKCLCALLISALIYILALFVEKVVVLMHEKKV